MNSQTLTLRKSTIKTIEMTYGFDNYELAQEAADYGYTLGRKYGCYTFTDEAGEIVDFGHPVSFTRNGIKYGGVLWSERESLFECNGEWFSTCLDEELIDSINAF